MDIRLLLTTLAILAFLGVAFYSIYTVEDEPCKKI